MKLLLAFVLFAATLTAQGQSTPGDWSAVSKLRHHPNLFIQTSGSSTGPQRCRLDHVEGTRIFCVHEFLSPAKALSFTQSDITSISREHAGRLRTVIACTEGVLGLASLVSGGLAEVAVVGFAMIVTEIVFIWVPYPRELIYEKPQPPTPSPASIP